MSHSVSIPTDPDTGELLPLCPYCRHLTNAFPHRCRAFPAGIPAAVWNLDQPHNRPIEGDGGFRFDPWTPEELRDQVAAGLASGHAQRR